MAREAELHDGTVLEFPDGTADDVIQRTVKNLLAERRTAETPALLRPRDRRAAANAQKTDSVNAVSVQNAGSVNQPSADELAAAERPALLQPKPRRQQPQPLVAEPPGTFPLTASSVMNQPQTPPAPDEGPIAGTLRGAGRFVADVAGEGARAIGRAAALPVRLGAALVGKNLPGEQAAAPAPETKVPPSIGPLSPTFEAVPPIPASTTDPIAIARNVAGQVPGLPRRIYERAAEAAAGNVQSTAEAVGADQLAQRAASVGADAARKGDMAAMRRPTMDQFVPKAIVGGLESVPQTLMSAGISAATPGGLPAKLTTSLLPFFMGAQGESYSQLRRGGYSPEQARFYSTVQGAAEAGTELIPMKKLIGVMAAPEGQIFRRVLNYMWAEGGTEQVNTLINQAVDLATTRPDLTPRQIAQELIDTAGATAVTGVATAGAVGGMARLRRAAEPTALIRTDNVPESANYSQNMQPAVKHPVQFADQAGLTPSGNATSPPAQTRSEPGSNGIQTSPVPGLPTVDGLYGQRQEPIFADQQPGSAGDLKDILDDPRPLEQIRAEQEAQRQAEARATQEAEIRPIANDVQAAEAQRQQEHADVRAQAQALSDQMRGQVSDLGASPGIDAMRDRWAQAGLPDSEWDALWTAPIEGASTPKDPVVVSSSADIDAAVERIDREATPGQHEAGNARRAHFRFAEGHPLHGIGDVSIETARGEQRAATDGSWVSPPLGGHYGYIKIAEGMDGDKLDAFFGPDLTAPQVYVFDTINPDTGNADEHKVMIGYESQEDAIRAFEESYSDRALERVGAITPMTTEQFTDRVRTGDWTKPIAYVKPSPTPVAEKPQEEQAPAAAVDETSAPAPEVVQSTVNETPGAQVPVVRNPAPELRTEPALEQPQPPSAPVEKPEVPPAPAAETASARRNRNRDNIRRGEEAAERVLASGQGEREAMQSVEHGPVAFVLGEAGDAARGYKGGFGLSHIVAKHGRDVLSRVIRTVALGKTTKQQRAEGGDRVLLSDGSHTAVLSLYRFGERETWLLTGWDEGDPGSAAKEYDSTAPTRPTATRFHDETGAGSAESIANPEPDPPDELAMSSPTGGRAGQLVRASPVAAAGGPPDVLRVREIINGLRKTLGLPWRQGRIKNLRAAGIYNRQSGVIRQKVMDDIEVFAHEAGHGISQRHGAWLLPMQKKHRGELEPMAYPGAAKRVLLEEGFAEFMRSYVTNRHYAEAGAPSFAIDFRTELANRDPHLVIALDAARDAYDDWLNAPSAAVVDASIIDSAADEKGLIERIKEEGIGAVLQDYAIRGYTQHVDQLFPIQVARSRLLELRAANKGKAADLEAANDPYKLARLTPDAMTSGLMDILHGVRPYDSISTSSPSLSAVLTKALGEDRKGWKADNLRAFESYLVSRRAVHEWDRYFKGELPQPPTKENQADHRQNIADKEAAHPAFHDAALMVYTWSTELWKKKLDAGLITQDAHDKGLAEHPDYVPFMRDRSDDTKVVEGKGAKNQASIAKAFRGSQRDIVSPIRSLMEDAYTTANMIARNEAIAALARLAKGAGPGGGAIAEEIPAKQIERTSIDMGTVLDSVERNVPWHQLSGRDAQLLNQSIEMLRDMELPDVSKYRPGMINERGEPIVYWWDGGERHALRLADKQFGLDLYAALTGLGREQSNLIIQMLALPSAALRYGVTADPQFFLANILRDQIAAWVLAPSGYVPFVDNAKGAWGSLTHDDMSRVYNSFGGIMGGANVAALDRRRVVADFRALRNKGINVRRFASWRALAEISEISETGTRIGVFKRTFDAAKARGLSDVMAAKEAVFEARDLIDFGRHGSRMLLARRISTFLNASIQGLDKATRVLGFQGNARKALEAHAKKQAGQKLTPREKRELVHSARAWAKVASLSVIGMMLSLLYWDDEEYQEFTNYARATHWFIRIGDKWLAYPKPYELAFASNIAETTLEALMRKDPQAFRDLSGRLGPILLPALNVPAVQVPIEIWANRRFFDDRPIVPPYLLGREAYLQYTVQASEFAKRLGAAINVSPNVIQHAITGWTGSLGKSALDLWSTAEPNAPNKGLDDMWVIRRFVKDPSRGSKSNIEFWKQMEGVAGRFLAADKTFKHLAEAGAPGEALKYFESLDNERQDYVVLRRASAMHPATGRGSVSLKRQHPMERAADALRVIGKLRSEIRETSGFTPEEKRLIDDVLSMRAMMESRNALIVIGHPGWTKKELMNLDENTRELEQTSVRASELLKDRLELAKVLPHKEAYENWRELKRADIDDLKKGVLESAGEGVVTRPDPRKPAALPKPK